MTHNLRKSNIDNQTISIDEIKNKINPHLIKNDLITLKEQNTTIELSPINLLNCQRFDLTAKYIYIKFRELNLDSDWGCKLYCEHIRVFNNFYEGDNSGKIGKESFLSTFNELIDSIRQDGFKKDISIIPVGKNNLIIDGSHRLAACLYNRKKITSLVLDNINPNIYDYSFFINRGLEEKWTDAMAFEYCQLKTNIYIAVIFPSAIGKDKEIQEVLKKYSNIVYKKNINLNQLGSVNFIKQIYSNESWLGNWENNFAGAFYKAKECFKYQYPLRLFLLESENLENIVIAKNEIRNLFGIGNHSIHINDTHEETIKLSQILLNNNSIHFLNHSTPKKYQKFEELLISYKKWLNEQEVDQNSFCIDGSSIMAAYGIRDCRDLDFIHCGYDDINSENIYISSHNSEIHNYCKSKDDIIYNPENHFYFNGLKFISLKLLRQMKYNRGEYKDFQDIKLIDDFLQKSFDFSIYIKLLSAKILNNRYYAFIKTNKLKSLPKAASKIHKYIVKNIRYLQYIFKPYNKE